MSSSCDRFRVQNFAGSKILMTMAGGSPTAANHHVELWARTGTDDVPAHQDIVRVLASDDPDINACQGIANCPKGAYAIVLAIDLNDGCMIDAAGHLIWNDDAQPGPTPEDQKLQKQAILKRVCQLVGADASQQAALAMINVSCTDLGAAPAFTPILGFVSWDDGSAQRPALKDTLALSAADRLKLCNDKNADGTPNPSGYWYKSPYAYSGNPRQLTNPTHGSLFGVADFASVAPPQILGGISLTTYWSLHNVREIWLTDAAATVAALDPAQVSCTSSVNTCRGQVLLDGLAVPGGAGTVHFELNSPTVKGMVGSASVQTNLDENPEQF